MSPALITGTAAAFAYLVIGFTGMVRAYHKERATRRAWNHYRSTNHG